jgi:hypothetical protein
MKKTLIYYRIPIILLYGAGILLVIRGWQII